MGGPAFPAAHASVQPIDLDRFIAKRTKHWRPSNIRGLFPLEHTPGIISLLAGKPNPATFPFEAITLTVRSPTANAGDNGAREDISITGEQLHKALQYGATAGLPELVKWLEEFQTHVHGNDQHIEGWNVVVGSGSQDLLSKAFQVLMDDGDCVMVETPAYPCAEGIFNLLPMKQTLGTTDKSSGSLTNEIVPIKTDGDGLCVSTLESTLDHWEQTYPDGRAKPKLLYTVPVGTNPTGATIPEERKIRVLRLAKKHDFLIFEDDAYAFLYYGDEPKPRSYFSLEAEVNGECGRVIRFDSFSKILASGLRIGMLTARKRICDLVNLNTSNANLQCSSTTQTIAYALLSRWGHAGLLKHCANVSTFYKKRRDVFERIARKYLTGVAQWTSPVAGMFLFVNLLPIDGKTELDSWALITERALRGGILAVPGAAFLPVGAKSSSVRLSFSLIDEQTAEEAFKRLRKVIDDLKAECST